MTVKTPVYLDYHATTPVDPQVLKAMLPYLKEDFGNSHSTTHAFGWKAEKAIAIAREQIRKTIGAENCREVIFTSGATESNNLSIVGAARANRSRGRHILTSATEHKAVLDTVKHLEAEGFAVTVLTPDEFGQITVKQIEDAIQPETILMSFMAANNEIGTQNPIHEIGALAKKQEILFHCDAAQGLGKMDIDVERDGIDLMSISGHKVYAPKGVGALYIRRKNPRVKLEPLSFGGGHEHGMRSGTMNTPGIVGLGKACALIDELGVAEKERIRKMRDRLEKAIREAFPDLLLNGHPEERLYNNLNVSVPYVEGESLLLGLRDLAISSGSACNSESMEGSYVLRAIGRSNDLARASIRFGLGRFTTEEEVDFAIEKVYHAIRHLRANSPLYALAVKNGEAPPVDA